MGLCTTPPITPTLGRQGQVRNNRQGRKRQKEKEPRKELRVILDKNMKTMRLASLSSSCNHGAEDKHGKRKVESISSSFPPGWLGYQAAPQRHVMSKLYMALRDLGNIDAAGWLALAYIPCLSRMQPDHESHLPAHQHHHHFQLVLLQGMLSE